MKRTLQPRVLIGLLLVLGVGAVYAALTLGARPPARDSKLAAGSGAANAAQVAEAKKQRDPHMARALELVGNQSAASGADLADAYAAWASEPRALAARRALIRSLLRERRDVTAALTAIEADTTPPERDPLWTELVESLSNAWQGPLIARGLDLIVAESRPRARRAVIASFAQLVIAERTSDLTPDQRQTLVNHFIDLSPSLPAEQRPEIDQALREIASDDVADILLGRGLDTDELDGARERKQALAETQRALAQVPE